MEWGQRQPLVQGDIGINLLYLAVLCSLTVAKGDAGFEGKAL